MLRFAAMPVVALACLASACSEDSSSLSLIPAITLLSANPEDFLGTVTCGPGGVQRYVVVLKDVSLVDPPLIPPSPPTRCLDLVSFSTPAITGYHFYTAEIFGYDRDDIAQEGDADAAGPRVVDPNTMQPVLPRWTTICGEVPGDVDGGPSANPLAFPTLALTSTEVFLHGCRPFALSPPDAGAGADAGEPTDAPLESGEDAADGPPGSSDPNGG